MSEDFEIKQLYGNLAGLKKSQLNGLERLYRRRIPPDEVLTTELAGRLAELSLDTGRQVGVLINRIGLVEYVLVGDERAIVIPELTDYPLGKKAPQGLAAVSYPPEGRRTLGRRSHRSCASASGSPRGIASFTRQACYFSTDSLSFPTVPWSNSRSCRFSVPFGSTFH